jgi:hypothetical protein
MKNTTVAIVAIAAVAGLLIASTAISTNQAFAGGHKGSSNHQTAAQECINNANAGGENEAKVACQNVLAQLEGHDLAANIVANQP